MITFTYIPHSREILPANLIPVLLKQAGDGLNNNYDLCIDNGLKIPPDSVLEYVECYPAKSLENVVKTKYFKVDSIPHAGILYGKSGGLVNS